MKGIRIQHLQKSLLLVVAVLVCVTAFSQSDKDAKILFHRGLHLEEVKGELEQAIVVFNQVVEQFPEERAITAKALLHIGFCWEKLGKKEAQKTYLRIIQEYKDQEDVATEAQARLAALEKPSVSPSPRGMSAHKVWDDQFRITQSISSDGRYLVFIPGGENNLYIHDSVTGQDRRLTDTSYPWIPIRSDIADLSPDGKKMAYLVCYNTYMELRVINIDNSEPRILFATKEGEKIYNIGGWSPDGQSISLTLISANGINFQIVIISVADGSKQVLKTLDRMIPRLSYFSPDGNYLVYDFPPQAGSRQCDIFLLAKDGSYEIPLVEHPANDCVLEWTSEGDFLFTSDRTGTESLWIIRIKDGRPQGDPELIKSNLGVIFPLKFTQKGSLYYMVQSRMSDVYIASLHPQTGHSISSPVQVSKRFTGLNLWPAWSPDGKHLAYMSHQRFHLSLGSFQGLMIRSLDTGEERMISMDYTFVHPISICAWFPDGNSILVSGQDWSRHGFFRVDVETGDVTPIFWNRPGEVIRNPILTRDGKQIFYLKWIGNALSMEFAEDPSIIALDIQTRKEREIYKPNPSNYFIRTFVISPDNQQLAYYRPEWTQNANERIDVLMVMPADGGEPIQLMRSQPTCNRIDFSAGLAWTPEGAHLLFWKYKDLKASSVMELCRISAEGGKPEKLGLEMDGIINSSIHPDGKKIAFCSHHFMLETWVMENFLPKED
ncbi:MAG: hypothetical protein PVI66_06120 [Candidatus Aminicenantes bacterium]|jgi:Tol biopolymer transport system component